MPDYIQLQFDNLQPEQSAILVAELSELGYDGFEEDENMLRAFMAEADFDESNLAETTLAKNLPYTISRIQETNWNAQWESGFHPVVVDDFVVVRADFHAPIPGVQHEIIITPKMSFGTGHHATTYLVLEAMRNIHFRGRSVADFGTGTGILSILAEKLGARWVLAIDNDDWSIANAAENLERNHCRNIECRKKDTLSGEGPFDIILANINKQVILDHLTTMKEALAEGGLLLLSGLLETDEQDIREAASRHHFQWEYTKARNNWILLRFTH